MKKVKFKLAMLLMMAVSAACEIVDNDLDKPVKDSEDGAEIALKTVASVLADVPLQSNHLTEVYEAVKASAENGYDEEYTMRHIFESPGAGVGDNMSKSAGSYVKPLRALIEEQVRSMPATRSLSMDPDRFLEILTDSDVQIYWPFSDEWDGETLPVITFDPEDGASANIGYRFTIEDDGSRHVEEVVVDEAMAEKVPVWVVNRNDDAGYTSLEMLRREDPDWGEGGGSIIVKSRLKTLILKDFTMKRNYDSWFAGASEFFVLTITGGCSFA